MAKTKKTDDLSDENVKAEEDVEKKKKGSQRSKEKPTEGVDNVESGSPQNRDGNRDSNGRFVKGNNANPGGRPKLPDDLKRFGKEAPARLRAIADSPKTPVKVKADIEKWFAEMTYGKAVQQQIIDASVMQKPVVFAGEDEIAE